MLFPARFKTVVQLTLTSCIWADDIEGTAFWKDREKKRQQSEERGLKIRKSLSLEILQQSYFWT